MFLKFLSSPPGGALCSTGPWFSQY